MAFRNDTAERLARLDFAQAAPEDEGFWLELRAQFDVDPSIASFNHCG